MRANDAFGAVAELAASQHGVFSYREAASYQLTHRQLRSAIDAGFIDEVLPSVFRMRGVAATWDQRATAATKLKPGAFLTHGSAARIHGLTGFDRGEVIHVSYDRGRHAVADGVELHRWRRPSRNDVAIVNGIPSWSLPATLLQLGVHHDVEIVRNAVLEALGRGMDPRWMEQTWRRMKRPGVTGLKVLLAVLDLPEIQGTPPESVLELVAERFARDAGLPELERQIVVHTAGGIRRIDLGIREVKLGIEATSFRHHFGFVAEQSDSRRQLELASAGWLIEYLTWWMTRDPAQFADLFVQVYRTRRDQLGLNAA